MLFRSRCIRLFTRSTALLLPLVLAIALVGCDGDALTDAEPVPPDAAPNASPTDAPPTDVQTSDASGEIDLGNDCEAIFQHMVFQGSAGHYYRGHFARAKDRGEVTHWSTGEPVLAAPSFEERYMMISGVFDADFESRTDQMTLRIHADGAMEIVLNSWGNTQIDVQPIHCEYRVYEDKPRGNSQVWNDDHILIVGRYVEENGVSAFTLALTEIKPGG